MQAASSLVETVSAQVSRLPLGALKRHWTAVGKDLQPPVGRDVLRLGAAAIGRRLLDASDPSDLELKLTEGLSSPTLQLVLRLLNGPSDALDQAEVGGLPN